MQSQFGLTSAFGATSVGNGGDQYSNIDLDEDSDSLLGKDLNMSIGSCSDRKSQNSRGKISRKPSSLNAGASTIKKKQPNQKESKI